MKKFFVLVFALLLCAPSLKAQERQRVDFLTELSPKLREFLTQHPQALSALIHTDAFTNKMLRVFYFYSDDKSQPNASHDFTYKSTIVFYINENQKAPDEFLCLLYEFFNSEKDEHFIELQHLIQAGAITKPAFVRDAMITEFAATKRLRDVLPTLKFTKKEMARSNYYAKIKGVPDDFEDSLKYHQKVSPELDPIKDWQDKFDSVRK